MQACRVEPEEISLEKNEHFPNNERCPVLIYRSAFGSEPSADAVEECFARHGWSNGWRAGIYSTHHYHSTAHEVLGCTAGSAELQVGGPGGPRVALGRGDVVVIPAGVSHKNLGSTADFCVVGAYADGRSYDMNYGEPHELGRAERNLATLPMPGMDPVLGASGPLLNRWRA